MTIERYNEVPRRSMMEQSKISEAKLDQGVHYSDNGAASLGICQGVTAK